jgi:hypothetical protein
MYSAVAVPSLLYLQSSKKSYSYPSSSESAKLYSLQRPDHLMRSKLDSRLGLQTMFKAICQTVTRAAETSNEQMRDSSHSPKAADACW